MKRNTKQFTRIAGTVTCLFLLILILSSLPDGLKGQSATPIPNGGFETWVPHSGYEDPQYWDTPNQETAVFPFNIVSVTKSTDAHGGSYSVKLETKQIPIVSVEFPGFITNGKLTVDVWAGTYELSGGQPINDQPTHLKGFFKYLPKGGDSCVIGIGLTKYSAGVRDSVAFGYFSTKDTVADWTPFYAWIDYDTVVTPDTMNIIGLSTAQEDAMTVGTVLYIDDLELDYTVGADPRKPASGIEIYNDRETSRLMIFFDFAQPENTAIRLVGMTGLQVASLPEEPIGSGRRMITYGHLPAGIYLLDIIHDGNRYCKKYFLNP